MPHGADPPVVIKGVVAKQPHEKAQRCDKKEEDRCQENIGDDEADGPGEVLQPDKDVLQDYRLNHAKSDADTGENGKAESPEAVFEPPGKEKNQQEQQRGKPDDAELAEFPGTGIFVDGDHANPIETC